MSLLESRNRAGRDRDAFRLGREALFAVLATLAFATALQASAQTHTGSANPVSEGWTVVSGDTGVSGVAVSFDTDFPGVVAWQVDEPVGQRLRYEVSGPTSSESWTLRARLRVVDLNEAIDADTRLEVANSVDQFGLSFGSDGSGGTLITPSGTATLVTIPALRIPATHTEYVVVELVYSDADGSADLFVNGLEVASDYAGSADTASTVRFGDGLATEGSPSRFAEVSFTTGLQACRDGIDNDGDGLTDFSGGDPDCSQGNDPTEAGPVGPCSDGVDSDADGLCDVDEGLVGTDPNDSDSDGDGLKDSVEVAIGSDPLDPDSDDDGLLDGEELGTGRFESEQVISLSADFPLVVVSADMDGDGDQDVVSGSVNDDKIAWYENTDGLGTFGIERVVTLLADSIDAMAVGDFDGDGDPDLVAGFGTSPSTLAWYENLDGLGNFGAQQTIMTVPGNGGFGNPTFYRSLVTADVDHDGDLDIVASFHDGGFVPGLIAWYENTDGQGTAFVERSISTAVDEPGFVDVEDLDGDGDLDVVSASTSSNGELAWFENLGSGAFGPKRVIGSAPNPGLILAEDFDGDGDADLLFSAWNAGSLIGFLYWSENTDGLGNFSASGQLLSSDVFIPRSIAAADIDADGDIDALSASHFGFPGDGVAWYDNTNGLGSFGSRQLISSMADQSFSVFPADLDGDGDFDVLSATGDVGKITWHKQISTHPIDADTDDDGLCDGGGGAAPECALGGEDTNGNGVYDVGVETDPNSADTDGDGFLDGVEVAAGSDPLDNLSFPPPVPTLSWMLVVALAGALALGLAWFGRRSPRHVPLA